MQKHCGEPPSQACMATLNGFSLHPGHERLTNLRIVDDDHICLMTYVRRLRGLFFACTRTHHICVIMGVGDLAGAEYRAVRLLTLCRSRSNRPINQRFVWLNFMFSDVHATGPEHRTFAVWSKCFAQPQVFVGSIILSTDRNGYLMARLLTPYCMVAKHGQ